MHCQPLLQLLELYQPADAREAAMLQRLRTFVSTYADCFLRSLACGHITGSAWIVDAARTQALLTHHAKLGRWLQPGGHCDGEADVLAVALREAQEETGLERVTPVTTAIFDVDIHTIPARGAEAEHEHFDVRFLLEADPAAPLRITAESKALAWVALDEIVALNTDASVLRLVDKTRACRGSS